MTPTNKGNYKDCLLCKFNKKDGSRYPCKKPHKEIRDNYKKDSDTSFRCSIYIAKY